MSIHDEAGIWSLLVLAHARLDQWSIFQGREPECDVLTNIFQRFRTDHALSVSGIEGGSARIVGDLEPAPVTPRDSVAESSAMIRPHGQVHIGEAPISRRRAEEKYVLLSGDDPISNRLRKKLAEPRTTSEDVAVSFEPRSIG